MEERRYTKLCVVSIYDTCLMIKFANLQFLMVTGGHPGSGYNYLDSTEIFSNNVWRTCTPKLPFPLAGHRVATINNRVLSFGN